MVSQLDGRTDRPERQKGSSRLFTKLLSVKNDRERDRQTETDKERQIERGPGRQIDGQIQRQTDRQDRQALAVCPQKIWSGDSDQRVYRVVLMVSILQCKACWNAK